MHLTKMLPYHVFNYIKIVSISSSLLALLKLMPYTLFIKSIPHLYVTVIKPLLFYCINYLIWHTTVFAKHNLRKNPLLPYQ